MILYRGSNVDIESIDLGRSSVGKDFGCGFYLTASREQAERMGRRRARLYGGEMVVSTFEFDEKAAREAGLNIKAIPAAKVQDYLQKVYSAVKKAADGGVIYKAKGISGDELGEQITTPPTTDKPAATIMYLYQHGGTWFNITVGHKAYFRKFKKDYGEKYIGVGVNVKEMLGEVN